MPAPKYVNQFGVSIQKERFITEAGVTTERIAEVQLDFGMHFVEMSSKFDPKAGVPVSVTVPSSENCATVVMREPVLLELIKTVRSAIGSDKFDAYVESLSEMS